MDINQELIKSVNELAGELGAMHATLYKLIIELRTTKLTAGQRDMVNEAFALLRPSQERFFAKFAGMMGGADPKELTMGIDPIGLPESFLSRLDPEARKEFGLQWSDELEPLPAKSQVLASARHLRTIAKLERDEQNTFAAWLSLREADGVLVYDWSRTDRKTTNRKGMPDFRIYARARVLLIEIKVAGGKLSLDQEAMIQKFLRGDTAVYVCYSAGEAIEKTRDWLLGLK